MKQDFSFKTKLFPDGNSVLEEDTTLHTGQWWLLMLRITKNIFFITW